jgi:hypothetical protein
MLACVLFASEGRALRACTALLVLGTSPLPQSCRADFAAFFVCCLQGLRLQLPAQHCQSLFLFSTNVTGANVAGLCVILYVCRGGGGPAVEAVGPIVTAAALLLCLRAACRGGGGAPGTRHRLQLHCCSLALFCFSTAVM